MKTILKKSYEQLPRDATVMLGQKLDNSKKDFITEESFSGRFAELTMYRGELTEESVKSISNCETIVNRGEILDWFVSSYENQGDVYVEDVSKSR
jgi:hypothetical protein